MKLSDKTYIIILIAMILGLSLVTYWRFQRVREFEATVDWPEFEIPKMEIDWTVPPTYDELSGWDDYFKWGAEEQKWVSPDNKLQFIYSAGWMTIDEAVSEYAGEAGIILEEAETLLFAFKFEMTEQNFALLKVSRVDAEKSLEEIISGMRQNAQKEGGEIEITVLTEENEIARLETISKYPGQPSFYSKGKAIFTEETTYLIFFATHQKDWLHFAEEAKEIFDSIKLLQ